MNPTNTLHNLGQSLWLDNITRNLVNSGILQHYTSEFSVTGLTSNPTIFDHAIKNSADYDSDISRNAFRVKSTEDLFFEMALADLSRAAELFQPIHRRTDGVDGWAPMRGAPATSACPWTARCELRGSGSTRPTCSASGTGSVKGQAIAVTDSYDDEGFAKAMEAFILGSARVAGAL